MTSMVEFSQRLSVVSEQLYQVEEEGCDSVPGGQEGDAGPEVACRITDTQEKDEMFDMDLNLESFSLKLKEMENRYKLPRKYLSVQGLVIFE